MAKKKEKDSMQDLEDRILGRDDEPDTRRAAHQVMLSGLVLSVLMTVLLTLLRRPVLRFETGFRNLQDRRGFGKHFL